MLRAVLDTNVLVSGAFWRGASFRVLELVCVGKLGLVASPGIIAEYLRIMQKDEVLEKTSERQRAAALSLLHKVLFRVIVVEPETRFGAITADPDDDKFIDAALAGKADFIVSKDKHLLCLEEFEGIEILTPEELLARI